MRQFSAHGHEANTLLNSGTNHPVTRTESSAALLRKPKNLQEYRCFFFTADEMGDAYDKNSGKENECFGRWYGNRK